MQMKRYWLILTILVSLINFGCANSNNRMIRKLYGRTINLTWDMDYIGQTQEMDKITDSQFRIVTRMDSSYCTPCLVNYLKTAESYMERCTDGSLGFICIIQPKSLVELEEEIRGLDLSELVLIYDPEDNYSIVNGLTKYNCLMSSFLLQ